MSSIDKFINLHFETSRDLSLDFVKGILVIGMIIYHMMTYFSNATYKEFSYVRFVTGAFIFLSGYIISAFYTSKYGIDKAAISMRLLIRGIKLLLIFTFINILIISTGIGNPNKPMLDIMTFMNNITNIYLYGSYKYISFFILLPISYVLMISPIFILHTSSKILINIILAILIISLILLNIGSEIIDLGIIGLIGLLVGSVIGIMEIVFYIKNRYIIIFGIVFFIYNMEYFNRYIIGYSICIMILIKLFYDFAKSLCIKNSLVQIIIMFGQYSLVCYIMQIVFLQGLVRILPKQKWGIGCETMSIFIGTNIFLLALCISVTFLRNRFGLMDKSYRFIFS